MRRKVTQALTNRGDFVPGEYTHTHTHIYIYILIINMYALPLKCVIVHYFLSCFCFVEEKKVSF